MNPEDITPPEDTENIGPAPILPVKKGTLEDQPGVIEETPIEFTPEDPS